MRTRKGPSLKPGTDLRAWLFTILHNEHIDRVQYAARAGAKIEWNEHLPVMSCSSNQIEHMEFRELEATVMRLPEDQREAVLLTSLSPWNYEEVAKVCNVPVGTIRSRLSRGRASLRKLIAMVPPRHGLPRDTGRMPVDGSAPA